MLRCHDFLPGLSEAPRDGYIVEDGLYAGPRDGQMVECSTNMFELGVDGVAFG